MWHYFALLCCALLSLCSAPSHATILIDEDFQHAALGTELSYFCDPSNQLNLQQVKEKIFIAVAKPEVSFGFKHPSCWFKFNQSLVSKFTIGLYFSFFYQYNLFLEF